MSCHHEPLDKVDPSIPEWSKAVVKLPSDPIHCFVLGRGEGSCPKSILDFVCKLKEEEEEEANTTDISTGSVHIILIEKLKWSQLSAWQVPKLLCLAQPQKTAELSMEILHKRGSQSWSISSKNPNKKWSIDLPAQPWRQSTIKATATKRRKYSSQSKSRPTRARAS